jgi:hypothetical protein
MVKVAKFATGVVLAILTTLRIEGTVRDRGCASVVVRSRSSRSEGLKMVKVAKIATGVFSDPLDLLENPSFSSRRGWPSSQAG